MVSFEDRDILSFILVSADVLPPGLIMATECHIKVEIPDYQFGTIGVTLFIYSAVEVYPWWVLAMT